jgi:hypothetical protein
LLSGHGPEGLGAKDLFPIAVDASTGWPCDAWRWPRPPPATAPTTSEQADHTLRDEGCGRLRAGADRPPDGSDALVAVSVVAMPAEGRAEDAVAHLRGQAFSPTALTVPAGAWPDLTVRTPAGASMLVQFGHPRPTS